MYETVTPKEDSNMQFLNRSSQFCELSENIGLGNDAAKANYGSLDSRRDKVGFYDTGE